MHLREDTSITITLDCTTLEHGALKTSRRFDKHEMELGDLVYLVGLAELARFSTDEPAADSKLLSREDPSGQGSILTIDTIDGAPPTPQLLAEIGEIYGITFTRNPFLADMRRQTADAMLADADLQGRVVAATNGWEDDGLDSLRCQVFLENGDDDTQLMVFQVNFKPNSSNPLGETEFEVPEMSGADETLRC